MTGELFLDKIGFKAKDASIYTKSIFESLNEMSSHIGKPYVEFINQIERKKNSNNAWKYLYNIFSTHYNIELFYIIHKYSKLLVDKHKNITIEYGGKRLENSSFGQRCTAALVILLTLGNSPIVIDEPEAHLDSLLIADYLVEIIKKFKLNRQIIFATHNANFVLNGDADLIIHLDSNFSTLTTVTTSTIENFNARNKLLSLEGGQDAFKQRDRKYFHSRHSTKAF